MKYEFVAKDFSSSSQALIDAMNDIIGRYQAQGYDLSLRQLYYRLVAANIIPNTEQSYKRAGAILSDARLAGLVDWEAIVDRGRELVQNSHWESAESIVRACAKQFQFDKWEAQPCHVEVMVEKQALEGVLKPVCRKLDIGFMANKGYSSSSAMYEAGRRLADKMSFGKHIAIIYLGDHDPSGIDMTRDVEERLLLFSEHAAYYEDEALTFDVVRVALNMPQIDQYKPPPNPAKLTDSRCDGYIRRFGSKCWELDALEPNVLASLVENAVLRFRDDDLWEAAIARERRARQVLSEIEVPA